MKGFGSFYGRRFERIKRSKGLGSEAGVGIEKEEDWGLREPLGLGRLHRESEVSGVTDITGITGITYTYWQLKEMAIYQKGERIVLALLG